MERLKKTGTFLKQTMQKFKEDNFIKLAATLSFITIFAIPPILIIITSTIGFFLGEDDVKGKLFSELTEIIGVNAVNMVKDIIFHFRHTDKSIGRSIFTVLVFILASSMFFAVIQSSLNFIWRVRPKPKINFLKVLEDRLISFAIIFGLGILFMFSIFVDAAMAILKDYLSELLPEQTLTILHIIKFVVSFCMLVVIFAGLFKFLPDVIIKWRVTWVGAIITAIFFTIGKYLITFGLTKSNIDSMYGAAGSMIILLLWVFYSSLIFFFGAEITRQYAKYFSVNIKPKSQAVKFEFKEIDIEE